MYFVFTANEVSVGVGGEERGEDVQSLSVYTRPTPSRPRRIPTFNHEILDARQTRYARARKKKTTYGDDAVEHHPIVVAFFCELCKVFACLWNVLPGQVQGVDIEPGCLDLPWGRDPSRAQVGRRPCLSRVRQSPCRAGFAA